MSAAHPRLAARELHRSLSGPDVALVLFFCSPEYETAEFAVALEELFTGVLVVGCSSAGEIGPGGYKPGGYNENWVSAVSFARPDFEAAAELLIADGDVEVGRTNDIITALRREFDQRVRISTGDVSRFALLLTDSTTRREEALASLVGGALPTEISGSDGCKNTTAGA